LITKARASNGDISDKTISRRTAAHVLASFKTMLNDAQTRGSIAYNPAQPVKIKTKDRERAPIQIGVEIPDRPDVLAIVSASSGMWRVLFRTDSSTGMRSSELRSLAWPNVDLDKNELRVRNRADRKGKIGPCKSK